MIPPDSPYWGQVRLLMDVMPAVAEEACFALKGGTAINFFVRDMPRLSVDIDLAYLPIEDRDISLRAIDQALRRIAERLSGYSPSYDVALGDNERSGLSDTLGGEQAGALLFVFPHQPHHHTIDPGIFLRADDRVGLVLRLEDEAAFFTGQAFQREFVVDDGDDDVAGHGCHALFLDDAVARMNAGVERLMRIEE